MPNGGPPSGMPPRGPMMFPGGFGAMGMGPGGMMYTGTNFNMYTAWRNNMPIFGHPAGPNTHLESEETFTWRGVASSIRQIVRVNHDLGNGAGRMATEIHGYLLASSKVSSYQKKMDRIDKMHEQGLIEDNVFYARIVKETEDTFGWLYEHGCITEFVYNETLKDFYREYNIERVRTI